MAAGGYAGYAVPVSMAPYPAMLTMGGTRVNCGYAGYRYPCQHLAGTRHPDAGLDRRAGRRALCRGVLELEDLRAHDAWKDID